MARLPNEVIERIKQEVSLVRLIQSQGHSLKKHGKDLILSCPFHDDKTPSLVISPNTNLWHCMGACQKGGSVIDWVMLTQGVSFRHAAELLQNDLGLVANTSTKPVKKSTNKKLTSPLAADKDDQVVLNEVIDYYHETLKQSPEALAYLDSRGLNHPELINTFKLGYANRTLGYRLPEKNRKAGAEIRSKLQTMGILRASGHEHFSGSLVVPVFVGHDEGYQVSEVYGRKILGNRLRKGTPQHLYLPGAHQGVWNHEGLQGAEEVILCEALIDAMTFWVNGIKNVTASYGTSGFTNDHLAAFKEYKIKRVLIAYDRDDAGENAAQSLAAKLNEAGIEAYRILFPKGMDANDYALKMKPAHKALELVIRKAVWLGKGKAPEITIQSKVENIEPESDQLLAIPTPEMVNIKQDHPVSEPDLPLAAQRIPKAVELIEAEVTEHEINITLGDRAYRVRGLAKNKGYEQLKINLMVRKEEHFHTDKIDLYSAKQRAMFSHQAGLELSLKDEVIKVDLGKLLLKLESLQAQQQEEARKEKNDGPKIIDDEERQEALALLKDKSLLSRILADFNAAGVVGEETNKLVGYLACASRKLDKPLAVMIQSSSAAGKSSLMDAILAFMPEEERMQYSAMTGQSLFYMGETQLKNKILAIAEEEGVSNASYALKLLQSEGEVTIASTGKDETTGNLVTQEYRVEGPVMLFMTTTAIDIDEELLNRCLVLTVNEGRAQTQAIHRAQRQRRTLEGLQAKIEKDSIIQLHQNAQRLLRPLAIINPYADQLTFLDDKTRTRRDHEKYLTLIDSIALLHQYQRDVKTIQHNGQTMEYIEVTLDDIETANRLANEVLGKSLDELPPQTRKLLRQIQQMVKKVCTSQKIIQSHYRFSRKQIREYAQLGNTQLKVHCQRLEEMEYLLPHRGGRGQSFEYELLYDMARQDDQSCLMGLINAQKLRSDAKKSEVNQAKSEPSRSQVGAVSARSRSTKTAVQPSDSNEHHEKQYDFVENHYIALSENVASHHNQTHQNASPSLAASNLSGEIC